MLTAFINIVLFLKGKNFTIIREFDMGGGVVVKEYVYNLKRFLTDVWPPLSGKGFPIKSAVRERDGTDVTEMVLKFSGPRKNYINPLSLSTKRKKVFIEYKNFGKLSIVYKDVWEPYEGNVIITDIMGVKKIVQCTTKNKNVTCISS